MLILQMSNPHSNHESIIMQFSPPSNLLPLLFSLAPNIPPITYP